MGHTISIFEDLDEIYSRPLDGPNLRQELAAAFARCTRPFSQLKNLGIPPRELVLGEWFKQGDLGFVYAPRGLGKTWLSLAMATAVANGLPCGPWAANGARKVLYVDGEMPCEDLEARLAGLGATDGLSVLSHEALFHLDGRVLNLADVASQDALTDHIRREGVELLVLDNLSCLFSGVAENDADAWQGVLNWLLILRRLRIAVILVHHSGRNKETMRGTSRREDASFWIIRLDDVANEKRVGAQFVSRFTKDRNTKKEQGALEWRFQTDESGLVQVQTTEASSMDVFREWVEDGLTGAEDIAHEMGISKGTVSKLAKRAMAEGWLKKNGREYAIA